MVACGRRSSCGGVHARGSAGATGLGRHHHLRHLGRDRSLVRAHHSRRREVLGRQRLRPAGQRHQRRQRRPCRRRGSRERRNGDLHREVRQLRRGVRRARCWGYGISGTLGDGGDSNSNVPVDVVGLTSGVTAISAGKFEMCAVVSGGAKCWGYNLLGQLGDGTYTNRNVPVDVVGLTSLHALRRPPPHDGLRRRPRPHSRRPPPPARAPSPGRSARAPARRRTNHAGSKEIDQRITSTSGWRGRPSRGWRR